MRKRRGAEPAPSPPSPKELCSFFAILSRTWAWSVSRRAGVASRTANGLLEYACGIHPSCQSMDLHVGVVLPFPLCCSSRRRGACQKLKPLLNLPLIGMRFCHFKFSSKSPSCAFRTAPITCIQPWEGFLVVPSSTVLASLPLSTTTVR